MPINKNHEFEDLDGVKCAIVEKNASAARVEFLKVLLEFNKFTVVVVPTPAPRSAPVAAPPAPPGSEQPVETEPPPPPPPTTFTVGVTDLRFNPTNAIFGRLLKTRDGNIVTLAYWQQQDAVSDDELPYFAKGRWTGKNIAAE